MERSGIVIGIAILLGAALVAIAIGQWGYLNRGYSLGISLNGGPTSVSHIDFPIWRKVAQVVLGIAGFTALWFFGKGKGGASPVAWTTLAVAISLGVSDVIQYGTIGSPTTKWSILLFFGLALTVQFRSKLSLLDW